MPLEAYLCRELQRGYMATVWAHSLTGAKAEYLAKQGKKLQQGDQFCIKRRMDDSTDWTYYQVL